MAKAVASLVTHLARVFPLLLATLGFLILSVFQHGLEIFFYRVVPLWSHPALLCRSGIENKLAFAEFNFDRAGLIFFFLERGKVLDFFVGSQRFEEVPWCQVHQFVQLGGVG